MTAAAAATTTTMSKEQQQQLMEIIQNGRQFLLALEKFAATNYNIEATSTTTTAPLQNHLQNSQESRRFDGAHDDDDDNDDDEDSPTRPPFPSTAAAARTKSAITTTRTTMLTTQGPIAQFCAKTGKVLAQYQSRTEAAESIVKSSPPGSTTNVSACRAAITSILIGRRKKPTYKGFYFRRIGDSTTPMPSFPITIQKQQQQKQQQQQQQSVVVRTTKGSGGNKRQREENDNNNTTKSRKKYKKRKHGSILQFCAETGKQLGSFETATEAGKFLASTTPGTNEKQFQTEISRILTGAKKRPTYRGFYFRDGDDIMSPFPPFPIPQTRVGWDDAMSVQKGKDEKRSRVKEAIGVTPPRVTEVRTNHGRKRPVLQFCAQSGKQLGSYESQAHAVAGLAKSTPGSKISNAYRTGVSRAMNCVSGHGVYKGFYFRYADDEVSPMPTFPIPIRRPGRTATNQQQQQQQLEGNEEETSTTKQQTQLEGSEDETSTAKQQHIEDDVDEVSTARQQGDQSSDDLESKNTPVPQAMAVDAPPPSPPPRQEKDNNHSLEEATSPSTASDGGKTT